MAYLPPAVVDALASGRPLPTPGSAEQLGVVVVFTDIVGFTPLSEALGAVGSSGTEQLSLLLNAYFDEMLGVIESYGGRVVKFGGDALTIVFPLRTAHDGATARRALQCGLDMQAAMGAFAHVQTLAGDFSLAIRVGVAAGTVWSVVLGDPDRRLEQVVAGRPIRLSVAAQAAACHGEVAADRSVLALCPGAVTWPLTARARRVERLARRPQRPAARPLKPATVPAAAAAYLHRSIADRLAAGHEAFVDEHRRVSVLFAGLGEVDLSRATAVTRLDASVRRAVKVIERLGGHLYQIDVSDKGFVLIALFGAPLAHDDDERRALHCALGLRAVWPRRARIGVNAGRVFCGQLGARRRLQYGALGDAVNLAARLMEAARPGQILVSEDAGGRVRGHFELPPIGPLGVKGKARPVAVLELGADAAPVLEEPPARFPLVGRGSELEQARALVAAALRGRGGALEVRGQAGVGKSRLAAEIAASARASGMLVLAGAAQPYADQAAYREWRAPLRGLLGLRERSGVAAVRELDHALEHIEPGLAARAPLLASPLNLRIPETELTRRLPPELRAELLCSMVLTCLRSASRRRPLLVLLEDGHWMGEPSRGLLEHVVRNLSELSMLVVVTGRHAQGEPPPLEPTSQVKLLELGELAAASTEELAALALSTAFAEAEPPPRLVTAVAERSGGNPLFVEELVSFLRGVAATVEEAAETAGPLGQLPDTLHSVVLARVDQLGEDEKATLKVASVIGRRFPAGWVSGSAPELGGREAVTRCLGALAAAELTPRLEGRPHVEHVFKHAVTRDVVYESMTHARRAQIHEQVARFVERAHTDDLDQQLEALAHHYGLSRNVAKKRIYLRQAGIAAKDAYANDAALDHFRRLAPLLKPAERGEIQRHIGEIHQHTGDWEAAQRAYRAALNQPATRAERAAARCHLGHLLSLRESYDDALPLLDQARSDLEQLGSDSLGSVLEYLTVTHLGRGDLTTARETASEQLRVADAAANLAARSSAADSLGLVHWYEGDHAAAIDWFEAALVAAAGAGDRRAIIHANNDLAGLCWERNDHARAMACLNEGFAAASEIGYRYALGVVAGNAGELHRRRGEVEAALRCYRFELEVCEELGDRAGLLSVAGNLGSLLGEGQRLTQAARLLAGAVRLARAQGDPGSLIEYLHALALVEQRRGALEEADRVNEEVLAFAVDTPASEIRLPAVTLAVSLSFERGHLRADEALAQLDELAAEWSDREGPAAVAYAAWKISRAEPKRAEAADRYRTLHAACPIAAYSRRYQELTGAELRPPEPLPELPLPKQREVDIDSLVERVLAHCP